jgi:WD40 repeat protein
MLAIGEQTGTAIWNLRENRQVGGMLTGFSHTVESEAASHDGRYVAAAEDLEVSVWDLATRRMVLKIPAPADKRYDVMQAAISPDDSTVAMPTGQDVEFWSIPQRKKIAVIDRETRSTPWPSHPAEHSSRSIRALRPPACGISGTTSG